MTIDGIDRALSTCLEMLGQRGYHFFDMETHSAINDKTNHSIALYLLDECKLTVDHIKYYIGQTCKNNFNHCLIIYSNAITPLAKKHIHSVPGIHAELFNVSELQYNLTKHRLQPKFHKLPSVQSQEFRKKFPKFSGMNVGDAISRFYDYRVGDVVRVTRRNKSENQKGVYHDFVTYRIVRGS